MLEGSYFAFASPDQLATAVVAETKEIAAHTRSKWVVPDLECSPDQAMQKPCSCAGEIAAFAGSRHSCTHHSPSSCVES